jgi:hypothetical protein
MASNNQNSKHTAAYAAALDATSLHRNQLALQYAKWSAIFGACVLATQKPAWVFLGHCITFIFSGLVDYLGPMLRGVLLILNQAPIALSSFTILVTALVLVYARMKVGLLENLAVHYAAEAELNVEGVLAENLWARRYAKSLRYTQWGLLGLGLLNMLVIYSLGVTGSSFFLGRALGLNCLAAIAGIAAFPFISAIRNIEVSLPYQVLLCKLRSITSFHPGFGNRVSMFGRWHNSTQGSTYFASLVEAGLSPDPQGEVRAAIKKAGEYSAEEASLAGLSTESLETLETLVLQMTQPSSPALDIAND